MATVRYYIQIAHEDADQEPGIEIGRIRLPGMADGAAFREKEKGKCSRDGKMVCGGEKGGF